MNESDFISASLLLLLLHKIILPMIIVFVFNVEWNWNYYMIFYNISTLLYAICYTQFTVHPFLTLCLSITINKTIFYSEVLAKYWFDKLMTIKFMKWNNLYLFSIWCTAIIRLCIRLYWTIYLYGFMFISILN